MSELESTSVRRSLGVIITVAATYVLFLLFAEFALLTIVSRTLAGAAWVNVVMAWMCLGGVGGSLLAARWFAGDRLVRGVRLGIGVCVVAAGLAPILGPVLLPVVPLATGLGLGWLTVTLVSGLPSVIGVRRLGLHIGVGTGLAYAFCNLPSIFDAPPGVQAALAAGVGLVGLAAAGALRSPRVARAPEAQPPGWAGWGLVAPFLTLIWIDSAMFYIIQHTPALQAQTWRGANVLLGNAAVHGVVAVVAGWWLDRGATKPLLGVAFAALVVAGWGLETGAAAPGLVRLLYTAGVSLYSVGLVYAAAMGGRRLAGWLFAVAGWVGSALGIGMVQHLHHIPLWFLGLAAATMAGAMVLRWRVGPALRGLVILTVASVAAPRLRAGQDSVARGRQVYIDEGCMHCHSQYVRPGTSDVLLWGPVAPVDRVLAGVPPLPGDRRQGPDLTNVGNRRTPEWNRLHLMNPQVITPGSRMPSYGYLFEGQDDETRGDALVAYLASLGAGTAARRRTEIAAWRPAPTEALSPAAATRWFERLCAACHGTTGRGNGPLANVLSVPPPDLTSGNWRHLVGSSPGRELAVARIIKFGLPGTPMAGREYLDDAVVISLARHVIALHTAGKHP